MSHEPVAPISPDVAPLRLSLAAGRYPGAELVAAALEAVGVTHTFGIPGTHNIELYDALARSSVEPVLVTDEQSAGFMADGFARSGGGLACANVVPGAGVTHVLSGIAEAYMDNVPLLVLTCGVRGDTGYRFQLHDIDQAALLRPICKAVLHVDEGWALPATLIEAARLAQSGAPGPVAVEVPAELYLKRHDWDPRDLPPTPGPRPPLDPAAVRRAATLLARAKQPLIHAGLGAVDAASSLRALAERLGAPVSTTFSGKGVISEHHPLWLWPGFGAACPKPLRRIARECDAALLIGARMGEISTGSYGLTLPEPSIQVDIDPAVLGANFSVDEAITADAGVFLDALHTELDRLETPSLRDWSALAGGLAQAHARVAAEQGAPGRAGTIAPGELFAAVQRGFPEDTCYTSDSGNGTFLAVEHLRLDAPRRLLSPTDFSCMGYCLPAAIGAAFADPKRPVVGFAGDGALLMTGLELLTAVQHRLPVALFVLRDRELGQIASFQRTLTNAAPCSVLPDYDLSALAATARAPYRALEGASDIEEAVAWARAQVRDRGPCVVDVPIDYSHKTYFTRGVVRTNLTRLSWPDRLRMVSRALARRVRS